MERMLPDAHFSFRLFAVHRRKVDQTWTYPVHEHPLFEINLVLNGAQRMQIGGKEYIQEAGAVVWVPSGVKHASKGAVFGSSMEYFCIHFDVDDPWLRRRLSALNSVIYEQGSSLEQCLRPSLEQWMNALGKTESAMNERQTVLSVGLQMLADLQRFALAHDELEPKADHAHTLAARLAAAIEAAVMAAPLAGDLYESRKSVEHLAQTFGYTPAYCNRVFQQAYGISPRQYMTVLTLRQAKLLLLDRSLSVEQVAVALGYRDVSHFSKQFKRWMHLSPTAYRQLRN